MDADTCYRAVSSRDPRFDGWFVTAVTTTGIYCRPSCPAMTPRRHNVRFLPTAAAAQRAGFRACRRCRPDASPGSPEWSQRSDTVARAMRLIGDGVVDRGGVTDLAGKLGYSERQLHRLLVAEVGAGAQALARAQRAHTARTLIETSPLSFSEIAFAAGFASIRQFNDTVQAVFATTPRELRRRGSTEETRQPGTLHLRLPVRAPFDAAGVLDFLGRRAVPGVETFDGTTYRRALRLPHDEATVALTPAGDHVACTLSLRDPRDVVPAVARCRRLLDLDADSAAVDEALSHDPLLAPLVRRRPGIRVPGAVDGAEIAVRAVLGQQVSVSGARTLAGRLVAQFGKPLTLPADGLTHQFPTADALADADPAALSMPRRVARPWSTCAAPSPPARSTSTAGPTATRWTPRCRPCRASARGRPATSACARSATPMSSWPPISVSGTASTGSGVASDPAAAESRATPWRPWRSYALMHLWNIPTEETS